MRGTGRKYGFSYIILRPSSLQDKRFVLLCFHHSSASITMLASKAQRDGDACASHRATGGIVCTGVMPPLSRIMHSNGIGNKANADSVVLAQDEISSPITPTRRLTVNERSVRGPKILQREAALVLSDPAVMTGHYVPVPYNVTIRCAADHPHTDRFRAARRRHWKQLVQQNNPARLMKMESGFR